MAQFSIHFYGTTSIAPTRSLLLSFSPRTTEATSPVENMGRPQKTKGPSKQTSMKENMLIIMGCSSRNTTDLRLCFPACLPSIAKVHHRACAFHDFRLSAESPFTSVMKVRSSSQVMTPGVLSVVSVYPGQVHFSGYAPNSLHISTHTS